MPERFPYFVEVTKDVSKSYLKSYVERLGYEFDDGYEGLTAPTSQKPPTDLYRILTDDNLETVIEKLRMDEHLREHLWLVRKPRMHRMH